MSESVRDIAIAALRADTRGTPEREWHRALTQIVALTSEQASVEELLRGGPIEQIRRLREELQAAEARAVRCEGALRAAESGKRREHLAHCPAHPFIAQCICDGPTA